MYRLLLIDNYDSFTWNLYQYFCKLGAHVIVRKNDGLTIREIEHLSPDRLVISPGPGNPGQSGVSICVVQHFYKRIPILGICLGHQIIGQVFGAKIVRSKEVMHGKTSIIQHNFQGIFRNLSQSTFAVMRYHSLIIDKLSIPNCLTITAWSIKNKLKDEIMAIKHNLFPIDGIQFHPESIKSENGYELLNNFLLQI